VGHVRSYSGIRWETKEIYEEPQTRRSVTPREHPKTSLGSCCIKYLLGDSWICISDQMPLHQVQIISSRFQNCSVGYDIGAARDVNERRGMSVLELGCVINCIALRRQGVATDA
jgi:hypothetical protein